MATAFELHEIANVPLFQSRVQYYMVKGAVAVMAEAGSTAGHALRVTYAKSVLDGSAPIEQHALAALGNATVAAAADISLGTDGSFGITDNDLEFAINEHWNAMSGVETG